MLSLSRSILPPMAAQLARHRVVRQALLSTTSKLQFESDSGGDPMFECGDFPKTKEERERAAKKYNLIIEDYEPYPEDEGFGDYPNLKCIGDFNKDWYDDYDDILESKHFGQPIERDSDLYFWERIDPSRDEKPAQLPRWQRRIIFFSLCFIPPLICYFFAFNSVGVKLHPNHQYKFKDCNPPGTKFYWFPTREQPQHH